MAVTPEGPKARTLHIKLVIGEKAGYSSRDVASATLELDLPADRAVIENSIGTMIDGMIAQVEIFRGVTTTVAKGDA